MAKKNKSEKPIINDNRNKFQWIIWTLFALENWILDFGRPIAMLVSPQEWFPLSMPSIGDYFHMAYNVITPFCLYSLMKKASNKSYQMLVNLSIIFFIMGASIHLVGDSINHRLSLIGYQLHLSVEDNPIMKKLEPKELVKSFELLYFYDEVLGHYMWYIPFFFCINIYFANSFLDRDLPNPKLCMLQKIFKNILLVLSSVYYWYLVTEGQITPLFISSLAFMHIVLVYNSFQMRKMDQNGKFLFHTFQLTFILVALWSYWLWNDSQLRIKYPGLIYVPEPWSVYSLHYREYFNLF